MSLISSISGIRGTIGGKVGENLTPIDIVKYVSAFLTLLKENEPNKTLRIVVGRDARISGEMVSSIVCGTIQSMGADVIDLGLSTTPTVEMSVVSHEADGGIIITASHNPMQWNALKLLRSNGEFVSGADGTRIQQWVKEADFTYAEAKKLGHYSSYENAIADHIEKILALEWVDVDAISRANFNVAVDAVHSTGGMAIAQLLKKLGVKRCTILNGEPTGVFAHNPEPLPEHLTEISSLIDKNSFHVGFVVDPDVDRLAIVMENGEMFGEEYSLVAIADYILQNQKGNTVSNLSSTRALRDISEKYGVSYAAAAVGEVNVVEKMKETNAIIGGEGNGGIILPALHYGRDALVGVALFLTLLAKKGCSVSELRKSYPNYVISKNKIELTPDIDVDNVLKTMAEKYKNQPVNTIDGVKIEFGNEWVHLRKSNTEPIIRIYSESQSMEKANELAQRIINDIKSL
jgi:phosphomannomutase